MEDLNYSIFDRIITPISSYEKSLIKKVEVGKGATRINYSVWPNRTGTVTYTFRKGDEYRIFKAIKKWGIDKFIKRYFDKRLIEEAMIKIKKISGLEREILGEIELISRDKPLIITATASQVSSL